MCLCIYICMHISQAVGKLDVTFQLYACIMFVQQQVSSIYVRTFWCQIDIKLLLLFFLFIIFLAQMGVNFLCWCPDFAQSTGEFRKRIIILGSWREAKVQRN
eukprot:TRINITY_DN3935_c2_g1_i1.p4 TRINITY_DN3935_c2_g1~~TRINITY_DN3935_c2_g1_i1.p4  ORF type:complete len:102 (-),score=4.45 TRINITY_DN3935_c2_g1_i1:226-531(-)